jgi:hypothetical protein
VKRFLRVIAPFIVIICILCIPSVTKILPEPLKTSFTELRVNAFIIAEGKGFGAIKWSDPRGAWEDKSPGRGVEYVGGR